MHHLGRQTLTQSKAQQANSLTSGRSYKPKVPLLLIPKSIVWWGVEYHAEARCIHASTADVASTTLSSSQTSTESLFHGLHTHHGSVHLWPEGDVTRSTGWSSGHKWPAKPAFLSNRCQRSPFNNLETYENTPSYAPNRWILSLPVLCTRRCVLHFHLTICTPTSVDMHLPNWLLALGFSVSCHDMVISM